MRNLFTWLNEYCRWKMFKWIWGLDNKQTAHIKKRIEESDIKTNYAGEVTMVIPNILL